MTRQRKKFTREQKFEAVRQIEHGEKTLSEVGRELGEDLKSVYGARRGVPVEVDRAILAEARKHLGKKRPRLRIGRWAVSAAAVAAVVVFAFVHNPETGRPIQLEEKQLAMVDMEAIKEDIDRNGRVDILDAFVLARRVEASDGFDAEWDINGDGIVDSKDIDAVAARAVRINKGA